MLNLNVNFVFVQKEDFILISFTNNPTDSTVDLMLQKSLNPSQEDVSLGHDKVYIESSNIPNQYYGLIEGIEVSSNNIFIKLESVFAEKLDTNSTICLKFKNPKVIDENLLFCLKLVSKNLIIIN